MKYIALVALVLSAGLAALAADKPQRQAWRFDIPNGIPEEPGLACLRTDDYEYTCIPMSKFLEKIGLTGEPEEVPYFEPDKDPKKL